MSTPGPLVFCLLSMGATALALAAPSPASPASDSSLVSALDVPQPANWDTDLALPVAHNLSKKPHVVEVNLDAKVTNLQIRPGVTTPAWTYDGSVPGPLIRAQVGDTVIVHFKNDLPEPTTIHWHGIRVPNSMDGVPDVTQPAVKPGDTFTYQFVVDVPGIYWYHPHVNSSAQVGWGLYGALVVENPNDSKSFGDELVLVLSDMSVDAQGHLNTADSGGQFGDLFGREGNLLLVNGKVVPHLKVRAGKPQRWRIVNASRARYFSFVIHGDMLTRIGSGDGLAARPEKSSRLTIVPGERMDVVFTPGFKPGSVDMLQWLPVSRGYGTEAGSPQNLMEIDTVDDAPVKPAPIPLELAAVPAIDISHAVQHSLNLTIDTVDGKLEMGINGVPYSDSNPPTLQAHLGETDVWTVINHTAFAHPFHLHGYSFQVLGTDIPEWKDTVNVPVNSSVRLAVMFDQRPGIWMFHCHILDHAEAGMMGTVQVK